MRYFLTLFALIFLIFSCTKEVPESEKKAAKLSIESEVRKVVENISTSFNSGKIDFALLSFSEDYSEFVPDADSARSRNILMNDWKNFIAQNPKGLVKIVIENVYISEELSAVQMFTSYLVPDPLNYQMSPAYSERSIKLLRKVKNGNWKIFRSLSTTAFSYD